MDGRNEDQQQKLLEASHTLSEVQEKLSELGLRLGMRVPASASA